MVVIVVLITSFKSHYQYQYREKILYKHICLIEKDLYICNVKDRERERVDKIS